MNKTHVTVLIVVIALIAAALSAWSRHVQPPSDGPSIAPAHSGRPTSASADPCVENPRLGGCLKG